MIDEMTGPGGWGLLDLVTGSGGTPPVVVSDAGYGEGADFPLELETPRRRDGIAGQRSRHRRPRRPPNRRAGAPGKDPLAGRARLPRAENRPEPRPLRGPLLPGLAPPRHPRRPRPGVLHYDPHRPKSPCAG